MFRKEEEKFMEFIILLEVKKNEISMVKQPKIAVNTFDDKACYINNYESIPWGYSEYEQGDEFLPIKQKIF